MENGGRDSTDDWQLPARSLPPTLAELEARIDEALTIARASEAAVVTVGAAAIESAEQARRAADLAVKASEAASRAADGTGARGPADTNGAAAAHAAAHEDDRLVRFRQRADRLGARFTQLSRR
ncbi:MAG: hypothetical protein QOE56_2587 [Solirubrobacterales bacterium]|nr:hypothetical protein [Solirubrobacterales bacterium]